MQEPNDSIPFSCFKDDQNRNLARPWTKFWPPEKGSVVWSWLESNNPEALNWRHDPTNPFDRPWRRWTKPKSKPCSDNERGKTKFTEEPFAQEQFRPHVECDKLLAFPLVANHLLNWNSESEIEAYIRHLKPSTTYLAEKPYLSRLPDIAGFDRTNIIDHDYLVTLQNIAVDARDYSLDVSGFEYRILPFSSTIWDDKTVIENYIPLVEKWLRDSLGADDVQIYAFNVNRCTSRKELG